VARGEVSKVAAVLWAHLLAFSALATPRPPTFSPWQGCPPPHSLSPSPTERWQTKQSARPVPTVCVLAASAYTIYHTAAAIRRCKWIVQDKDQSICDGGPPKETELVASILDLLTIKNCFVYDHRISLRLTDAFNQASKKSILSKPINPITCNSVLDGYMTLGGVPMSFICGYSELGTDEEGKYTLTEPLLFQT
jgi:hypothetical protein